VNAASALEIKIKSKSENTSPDPIKRTHPPLFNLACAVFIAAIPICFPIMLTPTSAARLSVNYLELMGLCENKYDYSIDHPEESWFFIAWSNLCKK
jgi:hypothetical protein